LTGTPTSTRSRMITPSITPSRLPTKSITSTRTKKPKLRA
jgi:hypothetical protein